MQDSIVDPYQGKSNRVGALPKIAFIKDVDLALVFAIFKKIGCLMHTLNSHSLVTNVA